jgi:serine/threonine protein kinase
MSDRSALPPAAATIPSTEEADDGSTRSKFGSTDSPSDALPPPPPAPAPDVSLPESAATLADTKIAAPPPNLPDYEILGELGHGGMGVVYKARQRSLNRLVALKMIRSGSQARPEDLVRFLTEAEAVARLQHPHIVQIHAFGQHNGQPYFALEFVDGGSLDKQLAHTPQAARTAAALLETLARTMHAVHQHGILHRDLKPANILLAPAACGLAPAAKPQAAALAGGSRRNNYTPKITDVGLAKRLADSDGGLTSTHAILGTPYYMAPEQAAGNTRAIGPATDVYALGAILYEVLTGRPPFQGATVLDTLELVRAAEPVPPRRLQPKTPRDLETICLKCLEKEPHRRYASAEALADDLKRFLANEPIRARPVGPVTRTRKWVVRNPGKAVALGAALLVVLGLLLWQRAELRHRKNLLQVDESDYQALLIQLAADRFADVSRTIERALQRLDAEPALAGQRSRWDRAIPIVQFYLQADQAWFRAGEERYEEGKTACETALHHLNILDDRGQFLASWWKHLPARTLLPVPEKQLEQEVYRQLLLLTYLRAMPGLDTLNRLQSLSGWDKFVQSKTIMQQRDQAVTLLHSAQEALSQAQHLHQGGVVKPAQTVQWFEELLADVIRRAGPAPDKAMAQEKGKRKDPTPLTDAIDHFFSGTVHYFLARSPATSKVKQQIEEAWKGKLDFRTPLITAADHLREATQLEPKRFFPHFVLGRTLVETRDYRGAEVVFTTCVILRPDYPVSFQLRALTLAQQAQQLKPGDERRTTLLRRCARDADTALKGGQSEPAIYWSRGEMFRVLHQDREALQAYAHGLEKDTELLRKVSRRNELDNVSAFAKELIERDPRDADAHAVLALVHLARGENARAKEAAETSLRINSNNRRAQAVLDRLR